jgi:hypothetical protein
MRSLSSAVRITVPSTEKPYTGTPSMRTALTRCSS